MVNYKGLYCYDIRCFMKIHYLGISHRYDSKLYLSQYGSSIQILLRKVFSADAYTFEFPNSIQILHENNNSLFSSYKQNALKIRHTNLMAIILIEMCYILNDLLIAEIFKWLFTCKCKDLPQCYCK